MALYIKDETVNELAERVMKATGAANKTEVVRAALQLRLEAELNRKPLLERLQPILKQAKTVGKADPEFDMKKYTDEMWDDI